MKRIGIFSLAFLASCTMEPKYELPTFVISNKWKTQLEAEPLRYENWWDVFEDQRLAECIGKAVANNQDLIAAAERVEQARDLAKIARSKLFPWFNASLDYQNQTVLTQLYGPNLPTSPFVTREHQQEYALPLVMEYEVDLWGKIRSSYKSANLQTLAREDAYKGAILVITTELANAYFQVRIQDALANAYDSLIADRQKILEIYRSQYKGQLIDFSWVAKAEAELNRTESMYGEIQQKRAVFVNMVAVLMGEEPSQFKLEPSPLTAPPPKIPEGVPAAILTRRPDLAEKQRLLESIHALLGVSYANYFPTLDVNGGIGSVAPLSRYFLKGLSFFWGIGSNLTEVLFDGLARYYKLQLNWAQFNESVAQYRQGILKACEEVENALSNLQWLEKRMDFIGRAIDASKKDENIASARYQFGVNSYLPAARREVEVLDDEVSYLALMGHRYSNTVQLIRALGGGW